MRINQADTTTSNQNLEQESAPNQLLFWRLQLKYDIQVQLNFANLILIQQISPPNQQDYLISIRNFFSVIPNFSQDLSDLALIHSANDIFVQIHAHLSTLLSTTHLVSSQQSSLILEAHSLRILFCNQLYSASSGLETWLRANAQEDQLYRNVMAVIAFNTQLFHWILSEVFSCFSPPQQSNTPMLTAASFFQPHTSQQAENDLLQASQFAAQTENNYHQSN